MSNPVTKLPSGWRAKRLRYLARLTPSKKEVRSLPPDTEASFVPMEAVCELGGLCLDNTRPLGEVLDGFTYFRDGDVVVAKVTPCFENGKGGIAGGLRNGIGFGTTELHVLRVGPELDARFLFYVTMSHHFRAVGASEMYGAGGQKRVPESFIRNMVVAYPSTQRQRAIADFLDSKTAAIDEVISNKQRLHSLSQTRRATLVTHAVTKGLDSDVPLRQSGAPAIGKIPAHWTLTRLKFVCSRIVDGVHSTPTYVPVGVPFVTVRNLTAGPGISLDDLNYISAEDHIEFCKRARPERGDVLITKDGTLGVCRVVETDTPFSIFVSVALLKPIGRLLNPYFLRYGMESSFVNQQLESRRLGSALKHIHLEDLGDLYFPLPPVDEQRRIAEHVRCVAQHEEQTSDSLEASIAALREYRQAIITAAVTGQLDLAHAREAA